jgi:hypothetical protein
MKRLNNTTIEIGIGSDDQIFARGAISLGEPGEIRFEPFL